MKSSSLLRLAVAGALAGLAACAGVAKVSDVTSQVSPDYAGHAVTRVMVEANTRDLEARGKLETAICDKITSETGTGCVRAIDNFMAQQTYTGDEVESGMEKVGADALLSIEVNKNPAPPATTAARDAAAAPPPKAAAQDGISRPWSAFEMLLISGSERKMMWYATGRTGPGATWDDLIASLPQDLTKKLIADGMLKPKS